MSKARLVITAVNVEKRPVSEVARSYGVARSWIYGCWPVTGPRARRRSSRGRGGRGPRPRAIPDATVEPDHRAAQRAGRAGPGRRAAHDLLAPATPPPASRSPRRRSAGTWPGPGWSPPSRPSGRKSSYLRFAAEQPNECWQSDFTHYPLAGGTGTEILTWLDDHSRYALRITAHRRVTGPIVVAEFRAAVAAHGDPGLDADRHSSG